MTVNIFPNLLVLFLRSLKCPFCPKSFYSDNSLKSHVVSHMDIRPWACSLCTKTFKRLKNVKDHVKTLHGIKADQVTDKINYRF